MYPFSIGVMLDSFKTDTITAVKKAQAIGAKGIQVYATKGDMSPEAMTASKRHEFLSLLKDHGLVVSALCGDLGGGFGNPEKNPDLISQSKKILDLAMDLETNVVTTHVGVIPDNPAHPRFKIIQEACSELASYADSLKAHFAIETGPETALTLKNLLDSLNSRGVAVNMDPANFVMVTGDDPVQAVYTLKDYIVHTHAKDGRRLRYVEPEKLYDQSEEDMLADPSFIELPLGTGDVDFKSYLKALDEIGFKGFLTIEREVGNDPEGDIRLAAEFLKKHIS